MATIQENGFLSALARFEKWLETPVVPGELPSWLQSARKACDEVGTLLECEIKERHNNLLRAIFSQDSELARRVDELKAKDKNLLSQWESIHHDLNRLCELAVRAEPDEERLDEHMEDFIAKALRFVIDSRKQDNALTTWYMESYTRDRGTAD